jgi:putative ABC transport system substrate-binding protein
MDRRAFVSSSLATAAVLAASRTGFAQQRLRRVALVSPTVPVDAMTETGHLSWRAVMSELRRSGLVEGQNVAFERYSAMGQPTRYERIGAEVAATKPDVIFVGGDTAIARAAAAADPAVPVVFLVTDALSTGLVSNLARPGRNLTGANAIGGIEIEGKRMALLHEAVPAAKRIVYLTGWAGARGQGPYDRMARESAARLGLSLIRIHLNDPGDATELRSAFATMGEQGAQALQIAHTTANITAIVDITALTVAARLPGIAAIYEFVAAGGVMAHFAIPGEMWRRAAGYVVRVLNGERAGDLPVQQPDHYNLIINVKAAKALGITIPPALLVQATEVIE